MNAGFAHFLSEIRKKLRFSPQCVLGWARGAAAQTLVPVQRCRGGEVVSVRNWVGTTPQDRDREICAPRMLRNVVFWIIRGFYFQEWTRTNRKLGEAVHKVRLPETAMKRSSSWWEKLQGWKGKLLVFPEVWLGVERWSWEHSESVWCCRAELEPDTEGKLSLLPQVCPDLSCLELILHLPMPPCGKGPQCPAFPVFLGFLGAKGKVCFIRDVPELCLSSSWVAWESHGFCAVMLPQHKVCFRDGFLIPANMVTE